MQTASSFWGQTLAKHARGDCDARFASSLAPLASGRGVAAGPTLKISRQPSPSRLRLLGNARKKKKLKNLLQQKSAELKSRRFGSAAEKLRNVGCGRKKKKERRKHFKSGSPPLMRPFSCSACSGGLFSISFFSRVFTRFRSVFSRLDDERGTAGGSRREACGEEKGEKEEEKEAAVSAGGRESSR